MPDPHYVHSYWGGRRPNIDIMRNLTKRANYIRATEFLPILWCNQSAYDEIKLHSHHVTNTAENAIAEKIGLHHKKAYPAYHAFVARVPKFTDYFYCVAEIDQQPTRIRAVGCQPERRTDLHTQPFLRRFLVCNVEAFINACCVSAEDKCAYDDAKNFAKMLDYFDLLNFLGLHAYAKDPISTLLVSYFGGFYADPDLLPGEKPFPESIRATVFVNLRRRCPQIFGPTFDPTHPVLLPFVKGVGKYLDQYEPDTDIQFWFNLFPGQFNFEKYPASEAQALYKRPEPIRQAQRRRIQAQFAAEKNSVAIFNPTATHLPYQLLNIPHGDLNEQQLQNKSDWFRLFKQDRADYPDRVKELPEYASLAYPLPEQKFKAFAYFDKLYSTIDAVITMTQLNQRQLKELRYFSLYNGYFYPLFGSIPAWAPSTYEYTGYQRIEAFDKAASFIQRSWRNRHKNS